MYKKNLINILVLIFVLAGCANEALNSSEPISSSDDTTIISVTDSSDNSTISNYDNNTESSNQEFGSEASSTVSNPTKTYSSEISNDSSSYISSTESTDTQSQNCSQKPFNKLELRYENYYSSNEPSPYIKEKPIYDILYCGTRVQVGDTLTFTIDFAPADATDTFVINTSDNLNYKLSGNTLSITVNSSGAYSVGSLSVSSKVTPSLSVSYRFTVDNAGNPLNDFSSVLSEYISYKGMTYCTVEKGYTTDDPTLSITRYSGAPAWDDMILRSSNDWKQKCLWLIDEYSNRSFNNVFFILTSSEVGFSAN